MKVLITNLESRPIKCYEYHPHSEYTTADDGVSIDFDLGADCSWRMRHHDDFRLELHGVRGDGVQILNLSDRQAARVSIFEAGLGRVALHEISSITDIVLVPESASQRIPVTPGHRVVIDNV